MKILYSRGQQAGAFSLVPLRIGTGVTFTLQAQLQLDQEEAALLKRYNLISAPLVYSDILDDLRSSFRPAMLLASLVLIVCWIVGQFLLGIGLAFLTVPMMTFVYFTLLRENLTVNDLLSGGRIFYCHSVRDLIEKEAYLEGNCQYLRQLLESAKHWGDREAIDILPLDKEAAKQAVLQAR